MKSGFFRRLTAKILVCGMVLTSGGIMAPAVAYAGESETVLVGVGADDTTEAAASEGTDSSQTQTSSETAPATELQTAAPAAEGQTAAPATDASSSESAATEAPASAATETGSTTAEAPVSEAGTEAKATEGGSETDSEQNSEAAYIGSPISASSADGRLKVILTAGKEAKIPEGSNVQIAAVDENEFAAAKAELEDAGNASFLKDIQAQLDQAAAEAAQNAANDTDPAGSKTTFKPAGQELGLQVFDISIVKDGKKIEPEADVKVEVNVSGLPDGLNTNSKVLAAHLNDKTGTVDSIADNTGKTAGTVQIGENTLDVKFTVSSFSDFTISYTKDGKYTTETGAEEAQKPKYVIPANVRTIKLADVSLTATNEEVTVATVVKDGKGATISSAPKSITYGPLDASNSSITLDGADFVAAWYGFGKDNPIKITGLYKDGDITYATVEGNTVTGMIIENPATDITLEYEKQTRILNVIFNVTGAVAYNGKVSALTDEVKKYISILGADTVKAGYTYQFTFTPQDGYSAGTLSSTTGTITDSNGTYSLIVPDNATDDVTININLTEQKTKYDLTFSGSNTTFTFNGSSKNSAYSNNQSVVYSYTYERTDRVQFQLKGYYQWTNNPKILNQLSITIDGESKAAEIPFKTGPSNAITTTIGKGYQVTVTKTSGGDLPKYTVVITNPSGGFVRGNIDINTNYKDQSSSEVWAKQLDGVDPLAYTYYTGERDLWGQTSWTPHTITSDGQGDQKSRLTPDEYTFYARNTTDHESIYYVKKKTGSTYSFDDLYLYVYNYDANGNETTIISRTRVSSLRNIGNRSISGYSSTDKYFTIPADPASMSYTDIRIFIKYEPDPDTVYTVKFDADSTFSDTSITAESTVKVGDKLLLSPAGIIPKSKKDKNGDVLYVFDGWYLDENDVREDGSIYDITADTVTKADDNRVITFRAHWIPVAEAVYAPYQVQVFFETENGYVSTADITASEKGKIGSNVYVIPNDLQTILDVNKPGWSDDYEYDRQEASEAVKADGTTIVKVFYKLKRYSLSVHKIVDGSYVDPNQKFNFTITLTKTVNGQEVPVVPKNADGTEISTTCTLKNGQTYTIGNIPKGTNYVVTEISGANNFKVMYGPSENSLSEAGSYTGTNLTSDATVYVKNQSKIVLTGVDISNNAIMAAVLLISLMGAAYVILASKHSKERR